MESKTELKRPLRVRRARRTSLELGRVPEERARRRRDPGAASSLQSLGHTGPPATIKMLPVISWFPHKPTQRGTEALEAGATQWEEEHANTSESISLTRTSGHADRLPWATARKVAIIFSVNGLSSCCCGAWPPRCSASCPRNTRYCLPHLTHQIDGACVRKHRPRPD